MTRAAVRIRRARLADAARILEMESHFPSDRMSARTVRRFLRAPSASVLVADHDGRAVGNLVLLTRRRSRKARIYSVVVDPAARGIGVARALVERAQALARQAGQWEMTLEVRLENTAARRLYAGLGYVEDQALKAFYDDGADGVRLCKPLGKSRVAR